MGKRLFFGLFFGVLVVGVSAQSAFPKHHLSFNAFRNPSIGLEYQRWQVSIHAGYFPTNFSSGVTTEFLKAGLSFWFLPVGRQSIPSSFYVGAAFLRGVTRAYEDKNALASELGFRWYVWKGLNLRLGVIGVSGAGQSFKTNPATSISYSIKL